MVHILVRSLGITVGRPAKSRLAISSLLFGLYSLYLLLRLLDLVCHLGLLRLLCLKMAVPEKIVNGVRQAAGSYYQDRPTLLADSHPVPLTITIVGAGIGGLAAAIGLRRQGHIVNV